MTFFILFPNVLYLDHELEAISVLDEVLSHASEPEQYFFVMLDQDLETISLFYDGKYYLIN